jgi:hypothetical protein
MHNPGYDENAIITFYINALTRLESLQKQRKTTTSLRLQAKAGLLRLLKDSHYAG